MRFLVDECTGPAVAEWLRRQRHEVFSVYAEARGMDGTAIIQKAYSEGWILISNDKDFGEKSIVNASRTDRNFDASGRRAGGHED